ncbi:MAG TPA: ABC transporter substrate-binding protein [Gaiellaceae bacterium]|nr:ABC transporter substrate-binding protein [Gaiellaceae bacterium]
MTRSLGRRTPLVLALVALAALVATAVAAARANAPSAPAIRNGGTLTIGLAEEPDALDPTLARTFVGRMVFLATCEKLYDLDSHLNIVPQLAASLPTVSKDKLTYTIKLRSGIKFNDGTPFNAAAVKESLERDLTLKGSVRASEISPIKSVSTQGSNTVVLHLSSPYSPLTAQLADRSGMVMSPKALAAEGTNFAQHPVCVGPFMFKDRVAGDHITLVKSPYYYAKNKVHFASIVYKIMTDPSARTQALKAGDIQVEDRIQATDVPSIQKDKNFQTIKSVTIGYQGLTLNIGNKSGVGKPYSNVGTPIAKSRDVRAAFEDALDRTTINKVVFGGLNQPGCFPIAPSSAWFSAVTKGLPCNLHANDAAAKQLIKASGIPTPITVHLLLGGTDPVNARLGQVIQAMEKQVGINVSIEATDFTTSLNRGTSGQFDTYAVGWSGRVDPDGNIYSFVATPGTLNYSGYSNPRLDYILNGARKSLTTKSRDTLYHAALQVISTDKPLIYLYYPVDYFGVSKKVTGVQAYGDGLIRAQFAGYVK